jgi:CHAT domain-containing protein
MKVPVFLAFFAAALLTTACSIPKYQVTAVDYQQAILRGELKEALPSYELQAREAEENAQASLFPQYHWQVAVEAYSWAADAARQAGQLQKAIKYGEKALEMAEKSKDPGSLFRAIGTLVPVYRQVRNFDKARELIERGIAVVKTLPPNIDPRSFWEGTLYAYLGTDLLRRREYEKAIDLLSLSLYLQQRHMASDRGNPAWLNVRRGDLVGRLILLGNAYQRAGRLEESAEQYQRAAEYIKEWGVKYPWEADLYGSMGDVHFAQKNFPQSLQNFQKVLALGERRQMAGIIARATRRIGDILRETGEPAEAIPYYQRAIEQIESTRGLLESEEYRQSYFEGGVGVYARMIQELVASGRTEDAFNYSERARSRAFLDVLGTKVQLANVKSGLVHEEMALQERIAGLKAKMPNADEHAGDLKRELREAERAYDSFLTKVRKQNKEQTSLMTVKPLTLKEVQELLQPGITLVEYFVGQVNTRVWIIEKERMQYVGIHIGKQDLAERVKTLRDSIFALGEKESFNESAAFLYRELIQPIFPYITGKELIIVPHDVLHYLPFHALMGSDGRYLIEKYPVYYLSSASLLQFVKEKRKAGGEKVLAFGNPDLGDPDKNLEYAELEAEEVKNVYPESAVYVKKEASEEKSKSLSPTYDILHFATHAQLNEDDPLSSAVLLAKGGKEDGRLEVREIFGMDLKANLVVLSGCDTALGKLSTGDELVGLTRAFIYAGTPSVVASLWSVDDSSTAQLMASFYRNLKTMSKAEALRQAQLELIRGEGRSDLLARRGVGGIGKLGETPEQPASQAPSSVSTSHPYFWAPFILVGDGK